MKLVLASTSPFRKAQLENLKIEFTADSPLVDEDNFKQKISHPKELCQTLAFEKANSLKAKYPNDIIIGADQLIELDNNILGKPKTKEKALEQLLLMSGKTHKLITSVCLIKGDSKKEHTDITRLTMKNLDTASLKKYIEFDNPLNCAGSYKIESTGLSLFSQVESNDHSAIIGLPLISIISFLKEFGFELDFI